MIADTELVDRSRRRDRDAFGALVERHQRLVVGVALARCGDTALAEDIAQDAFITAWRELDQLRDGERVGPWVAGIARNLAASAVRTQARRSAVAIEPAWSAPTPEDAALAREDRELLERALAEVPDAHRDVLVRYYLGGDSIAAIAAALGIREDLVKQRLSRGRRALRESVLARVDSALERARPRKLGGKVLLVMTAKKLVVAAVVVALAIGGATMWHRRGGSPAPTTAATTTKPAPTAPTAKVEPHVRKLPDPSKRTAMLEAIRERRAQRSSAAGVGTTASGGTSSTPRPKLPADGAEATEEQKDYIRAAVHELIPLLADCYNQGLERDPKLAGTILVEFTLEGDPDIGGVVGDSAIDPKESSLGDPQVRECIQQTMYGLQLDPPSSGLVKVRYPFEFSNQP